MNSFRMAVVLDVMNHSSIASTDALNLAIQTSHVQRKTLVKLRSVSIVNVVSGSCRHSASLSKNEILLNATPNVGSTSVNLSLQ